jgi:beta-glucosidase
MTFRLPALFAAFVLPVLLMAPAPRSRAATDPAAERASALLAQMNLDEKIGQLSQSFVFPGLPLDDAVAQGRYGSLLFVSDPAEINRFQRLAVEKSRLHVPLLFGFDVIHGFRTIFPAPLAMAASWDPGLVENGQTIAAREASAVGIRWSFAPMVDIARDPRWGRIIEGAGEDPYLGAAMARAQVRGFQGAALGPERVLACVKHFAGYGAAEGGRDYDAANISDAQLWNLYLPPFKAALDAGSASLMSAYMDLNDVPATGNRWLLHDVLREAWKFRGFVVSDADAVKSLVAHGFARDPADAAMRALGAGVNMEMGFGSTAYGQTLAASVKAGRVSEAQLDAAVLPILEAKFRLGLFEKPYVDEAKAGATLGAAAHRTAARVAAERSAVLLRNEGRLLPLAKGAAKRIAVIGSLADSKLDTLGSWTFAWEPSETVTLLAGLRSKVGPGVTLDYAPGVQVLRTTPSIFDLIRKEPRPVAWSAAEAKEQLEKAVALAGGSDIAVLVLGEAQDMSGEEASRSTLALPPGQQELLEAVVGTGKPVVLVLLNGRPLDISWAALHVPAILEAWYPGSQGGAAVANLLFGDANPGGKLPITWPANVGQVPVYYSHNLTQKAEDQAKRYWNEPNLPLFPFGFGLSYSSFEISNLALGRTSAGVAELEAGKRLEITADVTNTGKVAGDEVVQLYVHQRAGSASRPVRELKGFERVSLAPNGKKTVRFSLGADELRYWSASARTWVLEAEAFDVWVGSDSTAALATSFTLTK